MSAEVHLPTDRLGACGTALEERPTCQPFADRTFFSPAFYAFYLKLTYEVVQFQN